VDIKTGRSEDRDVLFQNKMVRQLS